MDKFLSFFYITVYNFTALFLYIIILYKLSQNFVINNYIKVFLFSTTVAAIFSIANIGIILGVEFSYYVTWLLSLSSTCLSKTKQLVWKASLF